MSERFGNNFDLTGEIRRKLIPLCEDQGGIREIVETYPPEAVKRIASSIKEYPFIALTVGEILKDKKMIEESARAILLHDRLWSREIVAQARKNIESMVE